mgnify:CR=1 FL=1
MITNNIYIYQTPESEKEGFLKIGSAVTGRVDKRIEEQFNTAGVFADTDISKAIKLHETPAVRADGSEFTDHVIHKILESKGVERHRILKEDGKFKKTEYFKIDLASAIHLIEQFKAGKSEEEIDLYRFKTFPMRPEQRAAVEQTAMYFMQSGDDVKEALWNAKMRFGKTFASYQLALKMGLSKILITTYKPEVEDAWKTDLDTHVDFGDYVFLRKNNLADIGKFEQMGKKIVAFVSFQDLHGENTDGGAIKDKHVQLFDTQWDIVIIDEFHYGVGSKKAKKLILEAEEDAKARKMLDAEFDSDEDEESKEEDLSEQIAELSKTLKTKYRLYLSGTPFKAISNAQFPTESIFNWTYTDEQREKENWCANYPDRCGENPYIKLPKIEMYLYKVSEELINAGTVEGKDEFSLNHFFRTEKETKKFINEAAVVRWLDLISGMIKPETSIDEQIYLQERIYDSQYPYDREGRLYKEVDHSLWYLNRVDSAKALKGLLEAHPVFGQYKIILAVGSEIKSGIEGVRHLKPLLDKHEKTITLSVGKLTTGVSIPKWKAVLFLRDTSSPENYFQTAFRAQTPCDYADGSYKETCYIFDFSPNRSLRLLTEYSEKLSTDSHSVTSEQKIAEFIRYLPVLMVDGNSMVELNAKEALLFDLNGVDAIGIGRRFRDRQNIRVTREVIDAVNMNAANRIRCEDIFSKIKAFRKFTGVNDTEAKKEDVNFDKLDVNNKKVKDLETKSKKAKDDVEKKEVESELKSAEKDDASEREKIRNLLLNLFSRIPLYMYITDATEENLEQVLVDDDDDLFRKATGITVNDFRFLRDVGFIKIESLDGYILKFLQIENHNYENIERMLTLDQDPK